MRFLKDFQATVEAPSSPGSTTNFSKILNFFIYSFLEGHRPSRIRNNNKGVINFPTCSYVLMSEHTRQALSCRKSFGTVSTEPWTSSWDILFLNITLLIIKQKTAPSLLMSGPPLQTSYAFSQWLKLQLQQHNKNS